MKKFKRAAARLLIETADCMQGYTGQQIQRLVSAMIVIIPTGFLFMFVFVNLSV